MEKLSLYLASNVTLKGLIITRFQQTGVKQIILRDAKRKANMSSSWRKSKAGPGEEYDI